MINNIGLPGLLVIAVAVLVLFGKGKVSSMMGEVGKGVAAFRKGLDAETDAELAERSAEPPRRIERG
ncbi:twin-arginine translocase TatA/TatE family subunit [Cereibacter sphaeroides]|uniref:twin-arginine translocase TatA/TatE family subunit n=1 Tax=Rhodobacterales TaxID=204455 RepID=UPI000BBF342C|nr:MULTISPECIES: twin-arginine translocase TatA/TatE family subunit [Paracoccaceae]MCE6953166.1 twin-arginine translocase TatA/TatE family subunit [Cereibacter sphaeroides]MCE6961734.1 twin-arginine translocase TatA/TatE family subunit [Cereibacter sphaeroides]MCE6970510.1 twin-arginine translocase TatA/TatE family subunit [Cereibacter sphaeroides]MCE6975084.1 twin-arginine translocase TatA/TatE family subunit [Cereibacter sphaeroides]